MAALAVVAALALGASSASADSRYAAPGGTGADPCADPAAPCSLYLAASSSAPGTTIASGDMVEMAPGTYSEIAGDLGPSGFAQLPADVTVRGEVGKPRPVIKLETGAGFYGAFLLFVGKVVGVEIVNEAPLGSAITLIGQTATAERVLARSTASGSFTCGIQEGVIRDSVCLNEAGGAAVGTSVSTFVGTHPVTLRNVTAIGSGPGSVGLDFGYFGSSAGVIGAISGKSVIARGEAKDVIARGLSIGGPGTGAAVSIELDHSAYVTTDLKTANGGSAFVTQAGTNENILDPPLLAGDGYHQLEGSPTVGEGALDGSSGTTDIDGQLRTLGSAPDIGADELAAPTATVVTCPASVFAAPPAETVFCTATVTDTGTGATAPTGEVVFQVRDLENGKCTLAAATPTSSSCQVGYTPTPGSLGLQPVSATYVGDVSHTGSDSETAITVVARDSGGGGGAGGPSSGGSGSSSTSAPPLVAKPPVDTLLAQRPEKRTRKRMAVFTFSAVGEAAGFQCKLDKGPFKGCTSPFKKRLAPGPHVFRIRAVGPSNIPDPTPEKFSWRILPTKK